MFTFLFNLFASNMALFVSVSKKRYYFVFLKIDFVKSVFKIIVFLYLFFKIETLILTSYNIKIYYWRLKHSQNHFFFSFKSCISKIIFMKMTIRCDFLYNEVRDRT
jgi:hypothetical protein